MFELSAVQIGFLSSVVTELLKFFPVLNNSQFTRSATAIAVIVLGTISFGHLSWEGVWSSLLVALASYKFIIQPLGSVMGSPTQA